MRRLRTLAPLLLLLVGVVAGCTGTSENVPPLLLAVGRQDPTNPSASQMVLVEDNFTTNQATLRTLTVVPGSARPLPYPAVASDVVDRAGARSSMVVLTRDLSGGTSPSSALATFNLVGIDPAAPTAFAQQSTTALSGAAGDALQSYAPVCPTGVTVSATGRYVTLLDDPAACNDSPRVTPNCSNSTRRQATCNRWSSTSGVRSHAADRPRSTTRSPPTRRSTSLVPGTEQRPGLGRPGAARHQPREAGGQPSNPGPDRARGPRHGSGGRHQSLSLHAGQLRAVARADRHARRSRLAVPRSTRSTGRMRWPSTRRSDFPGGGGRPQLDRVRADRRAPRSEHQDNGTTLDYAGYSGYGRSHRPGEPLRLRRRQRAHRRARPAQHRQPA